MAREFCKTILNGVVMGLTDALERLLCDEDLCSEFGIPNNTRLDMVQKLANLDISAYKGGETGQQNSLSGILLELESYDAITSEVWEVLKRPNMIGPGVVDR